MCGIAGELSFDDRPVSPEAVTAMTSAMQHRGPDHGATYCMAPGRVGLGFRRLSIIDLRAAANQPIPNEDGSVQLVFNGEIYNYREIRAELIAKGHQFRSEADSEVIVHLYEELGERAIDRLDGMFALAIFDHRADRLLLARDRAGKKPLFIYRDARRLVFASEPKSLLAHPELRIEIDPLAIPYYFLYGYVPHPQTPYQRVTHLEPGTVATFERDGKGTERKYWQLTFPDERIPRTAPSRAEATARVRALVTAAVERRLMSDVPLGAFLSGGIDSTIVVGIMSRLMRDPVRTFSIGFEGDPDFDETSIASATAAQFGTRHTEFKVKPSAVDLIDTLVRCHDGPFADSSAIPTYLVSQLTRQHVTVALTGDGGDEVFAGYLRFGAALAADKVPAWLAAAANQVLEALPASRNERQLLARGRRFSRAASLPRQDRLTAWTGIFFDDLGELIPGVSVDAGRHLRGLRGIDGASPLNQLLAANFHSYLHDDLLVKADRMSMANSLEARAPFLDTALMDYVAALPDDYKLQGTTTKAILRDAFADVLPDDVKRAPKRGFGVPLDTWFRGELRDYMRDVLLSPSARLAAFVNTAHVTRLVDEHLSQRANHGSRLWTLLTFERWLTLLPSWGPR